MDGVLQKRRILVVDDAIDIQFALRSLLTKEGAEVCIAESGQKGLESASTNYFDLALVDLYLPDLCGYELAKAMRVQGFRSPIYAFTGLDEHYISQVKLKESGFSGILIKDFVALPFAEIPRRLSKLLSNL